MKLRITESQLNTIKKSLNEGVDNRYERVVNLSYNYHGVTLKGHEINDIMDNSARLNYDIEIEARSWGIKDISLGGITGPTEIELEIDYYINEDETQQITIPVQLDWANAIRENATGHGVITVGDEVEIDLINSEDGGIIVKSITIPVYTA